jgi:hypothetical protein
MTPEGRTFAKQRLLSAPDLAALRRVWDSLGLDYARDPEIAALKDRLKEELSCKP